MRKEAVRRLRERDPDFGHDWLLNPDDEELERRRRALAERARFLEDETAKIMNERRAQGLRSGDVKAA